MGRFKRVMCAVLACFAFAGSLAPVATAAKKHVTVKCGENFVDCQ